MNSILLKAQGKKTKWLNNKKESIESDSDSYSDSEASLTSDDEFDVSQGVIYTIYNNQYIPIKYLGRGTFSRVWLTYNTLNNTLCAMKCIFPKYAKDSSDEIERNEFINKNLNFKENDVRLLNLQDTFKLKDNTTCLVYPLMGVSMNDLITHFNDIIPIPIIKKCMKDTLSGLNDLHSIKIIHTDLKPENILTNIYTRGILFYKNIFEDEYNFNDIFTKLIDQKLPTNYGSFDKNKKKKVKRQIKNRALKDLSEYIKKVVTDKVQEESDRFYEENNNVSEINNDIDDFSTEIDVEIDVEIDEEDLNSEPSMYTFSDYQKEIIFEDSIIEENIRAKIIDFGNCEFTNNKIQDEICARCYRPPENFMNSFFNERADMWSFGCLLFEFMTGEALFEIEDTDDATERDIFYLVEITKILGKIPKEMALKCEYSRDIFDKQGRLIGYKNLDKETSISELLVDMCNYEETCANELEQLITKFLTFRYIDRISANEALQLEWFS
jgi:serine/threonine protein kinase